MDGVWVQFIIALISFFAILIFIGYLASRQTKTTEDFAVAGRSLGPFVVAVMMVSTYGSASSYIGNGGLAYEYGWSMAWIWIGCIPGIILPTLLLGPRMRTISVRLNTITVPDFLGEIYESRFLRIFVSLGIIVFYIPMMIAQFKGVGILFEAFFDTSFTWAIVVFGLILIIYSTFGGLLAVAWTDVAQFVLMAFVMILLVPISIHAVGGWSAMNEKLTAIDVSLNSIFEPVLFTPVTVVFMVIYYMLWQIGQPYMSARFFAIKDVKSFKKVIIYLIIFTTIISSAMWAGIAGRILFPNLADADAAVPLFIKTYFPTTLGVLAVIGVLAAILTTVSAVLITVGTTVGYDLIEKSLGKKLNGKQSLRVTQLSTFIIGSTALILSLFNAPEFLSLLVYASLGGMACLVAGPVLLAVYDKKTTKEGAITASIGGTTVFLLLLLTGSNVWVSGGIGMVLSIAGTFVVSRFVGESSKKLLEVHSSGKNSL